MQDTKLIRTSVDGDPHALVLRRSGDDSSRFDPLFDLLTGDETTDVIAVTHEQSHEFLRTWHDRIDRRPRNVGVVSVGEQMRSTASASAPMPSMPDRAVVQGVADPADTDGVRDATVGFLDAWPAGGRSVVYFDSVTKLVHRVGADAATDFLREFCRSLDANDAVGYFCFTPAAHDRGVVREVASLFDTVLECVDSAVQAEIEPTIGDCFDAIADARRRHVLAAIADGEEASVADLTDHVTARTDTSHEQIQASLVNVHLPKLADLGVIEYDRERGRVTTSRHFERVVPYLRKAVGESDSRLSDEATSQQTDGSDAEQPEGDASRQPDEGGARQPDESGARQPDESGARQPDESSSLQTDEDDSRQD